MRRARSWLGLGFLGLVLVAGGLLGPTDTAVTNASVAPGERMRFENPQTASPQPPAPDDVLLPNTSEEVACGQCPNRCWRDKDCDRICGSLGGACVQINSCCRQCACFG